MDKILKDVGDIQSRLFDHRPVLHGEIRYFAKEFEEKRGYRENRLLENLNKSLLESGEQVLPVCVQTMPQRLQEVLMQLEAANHVARRVQQRELEAQQGAELQACAERRRADWEEFLKEQARLKEEVDEEHAKAVARLSRQYGDMKKDLSNFSNI